MASRLKNIHFKEPASNTRFKECLERYYLIIIPRLDINRAIFTQGIKLHGKLVHEITELMLIFQLLNSIIFHKGQYSIILSSLMEIGGKELGLFTTLCMNKSLNSLVFKLGSNRVKELH